MDPSSLFVAAGICSAALALTILSVWTHTRADRFLLSWAASMLMLAAGVLSYVFGPFDSNSAMGLSFALQTAGFALVYTSARQFVGRSSHSLLLPLLLIVLLPPVVLPILAGYNGIGIAIYNIAAALLLAATATTYATTRAEAPSSIVALCTLYWLAALSFLACATVLAHERMWTLASRPDNWAEQFNAIMCIAGITGIGALSIGLNNARAARRHREEAQTDALTGILNRRALFEALSGRELPEGDAVIAFDLDHFKSVNDRHGHAAGDALLRRFADALRRNVREGDLVARTGGEEFVLVLHDASLQIATSTAERIRALFAAASVETAQGPVSGTASAGVAVSLGETFEDVLHRADTTLYRAKDGGRNRVVTALQAVA